MRFTLKKSGLPSLTTIVLVFGLILGLAFSSVGFANWSSELNLKGTVAAQGNMKVYFADAVVATKLGVDKNPTITISPDERTLTISNVVLCQNGGGSSGGAGLTIKATIKNGSSVKVKPNSTGAITVSGGNQNQIEVTVTPNNYSGLNSLEPNDTQEITIKIMSKTNSASTPSAYTFSLNYIQDTVDFTASPSHSTHS